MEVYLKRKELWIFILSVFVLGGEIGLIANIFFTEFYSGHKLLFIILISLLLLITLFSIIKLMLINIDKEYVRNLIFTYDFHSNRFIDIPYNPSSVNARVLMDNQSIKNQEKIKVKNFMEKNVEFYNFNNNVVAQIILSRFIRHTRNEYKEDVTIEKLKELLVNYRYLDVDSIIGEGIAFKVSNGKDIKHSILSLPTGFKINCNNDRNINIKSNYGFVDFQWHTIVTNNTKTSHLLSSFDDIDLKNCLEIQVEIKLKYGYGIFKLFKKDIVEFNEFIEACKEKMDSFSIENSKQKYNNDYSEKILKYIENQFKDNFEKTKELIIK